MALTNKEFETIITSIASMLCTVGVLNLRQLSDIADILAYAEHEANKRELTIYEFLSSEQVIKQVSKELEDDRRNSQND